MDKDLNKDCSTGSCGGGCCGQNHDHADTIVLTLDDNSELECEVIGIFEGFDKEYIALLPLGDETVLIYEYIEKGEEVDLKLIESDEEFEKVTELFYEVFDDEDEEEDDEE